MSRAFITDCGECAATMEFDAGVGHLFRVTSEVARTVAGRREEGER
jgi:hypothetical protein